VLVPGAREVIDAHEADAERDREADHNDHERR
jgi:hypothetical protein